MTIDLVLDVVMHRMPQAGIACIMIGGHAVNHYGVIRATQDIDFMIASPQADVDGELRSLCHEFGTEALFAELKTRIEELRHA